ncbi:MAG: hypothetical protein ACYC1T_06355 [Sulfuricaulis sp.]
MAKTNKQTRKPELFIPAIIFLSLVSFVRVWSMHGTVWDDNAWLMSIYATDGLDGFLNSGFTEMRRVPLGVFLYSLFWLYKNTELYYVVWHSLNTLTQIGGPLLLYATCLRLFGNKLLAFFIAASLAVLYLDQTLPYASAINYRLGLLLGIFSFYATVRALQGDRPFLMLGASLISAAIAYTVFMEAVIALEPGRFAVTLYVLNQKTELKKWNLFRTAFLKWLPFLAISVPYALYKLMYNSYGIYAGIYDPDYLFLLDIERIIDVLAYIFLIQWVIFLDHLSSVSPWSIMFGIVGLIALTALLPPKIKSNDRFSLLTAGTMKSSTRSADQMRAKYALYIGLVLMVFPLMFFQFFRRPITWGIFSSHGTIAQFGYAVTVGSMLFMLFGRSAKYSPLRLRVFCGATAVFFSLAIFFNNLSLDLYQESHRQQQTFWKRFTTRFPTLPENATFLFDIRDKTLYNPMYYYYYEFMMNMLYAESGRPEDFRQYQITTFHELYWQNKIKNDEQLHGLTFTRNSMWGKDQVDPGKFIWVYYDRDQLLVNDEILEKYPESPYRHFLNKPVPVPLHVLKTYLFRHKVLGDT